MAIERLTGISQVRGTEGDDQTKKYVVGTLQKIPWPSREAVEQDDLVRSALHRVFALRSTDELCRSFVGHYEIGDDELEGAAHTIWNVEKQAASVYGFDPVECARDVIGADTESDAIAIIRKSLLIGSPSSAPRSNAARSLSFAFGVCVGRWDARYDSRERPRSELTDPFAPLPACSPAMVTTDDGLPLSPDAGRRLGAARQYPLDVAWDGILVDDPEHQLDVERRVRAVLPVVWGGSADAIEHQACTLLGVRTLRDWFRKPVNFFADHLKRYSKSRRQAPIYWPLSTPSCSYSLWIYSHRLTDETLFTAVNDFIEPKLADVSKEAAGLRNKPNRSAAEEAALEEANDLEIELREFRDELLRIAKFWRPNLNDGVQITAAPLWKLFQFKPWQKKLKETWESLEAGEYDWAHLAYSIWPDRVRAKCKMDKSLAIAHGLEDLYQEPPAIAKRKRVRKVKAEEALVLEDAE